MPSGLVLWGWALGTSQYSGAPSELSPAASSTGGGVTAGAALAGSGPPLAGTSEAVARPAELFWAGIGTVSSTGNTASGAGFPEMPSAGVDRSEVADGGDKVGCAPTSLAA